MKSSEWAFAVVTCLREKQFWRETARETYNLVTGSSASFGVTMIVAILRIGHRVLSIAPTMAQCGITQLRRPVNLNEQQRTKLAA